MSLYDFFVLGVGVVALCIGWALVDEFSPKIARWYNTRYLTSSIGTQEVSEPVIDRPAPATLPSNVASVTMPSNSDNDPLRVAEHAMLEALAILIVESRRKPFQNGQVPETRALDALFGVRPSSDPKSEYQRLRALLKAELTRRAPPPATPQWPQPLTEEQQRTRELIESGS